MPTLRSELGLIGVRVLIGGTLPIRDFFENAPQAIPNSSGGINKNTPGRHFSCEGVRPSLIGNRLVKLGFPVGRVGCERL